MTERQIAIQSAQAEYSRAETAYRAAMASGNERALRAAYRRLMKAREQLEESGS